MVITRAYLLQQVERFERQRDELLAQLNQVEGGLRTCQHLLTVLDKPEAQAESENENATNRTDQ